MTIKKACQPIIDLLESNKNKKVATILEEVYKLAQTKQLAKTYLTNDEGEIIAIFCYYHKQWELLDEAPYGKKSSSTTGFNTMCKVGVSHWTKQNKAKKEIGTKVLQMLENGEIQADEIADTKAKLMEEASQIVTEDMPICYETQEEALEAYYKLHH